MLDIDNALEYMDIGQKARLIYGKSFWRTWPVREQAVPSLLFTEAPNGLRGCAAYAGIEPEHPSITSVCYPSPSMLANSFDPSLVAQVAQAIARECRRAHVSCVIGPNASIKRHPLAGNASGCYGEDPLLAGSLAAAYVDGVQTQGIGAALSGFALANQQRGRLSNVVAVDERALRELHLRPFEIAVKKSKPWAVLASPTAAESTADNGLRNTISVLRDDWEFDGAVLTEWGGASDAGPMFAAGIDISMPGPDEERTAELAKSAASDEELAGKLETAARRAVALAAKHQQAQELAFTCDDGENIELARRAAEESVVLLRNDGMLPLNREHDVAIIGALAKNPLIQEDGFFARVDSLVNDCAYDALVQAGCTHIAYADGYDEQTGVADEEHIDRAVQLSRVASSVVVFAGPGTRSLVPGVDRTDMGLPQGQADMIQRLCEENENVAVVLFGVGPYELSWAESCNALMFASIPGCQSGHALADLLLGIVSPAGKLSETWPKRLEDTALGHDFPSQDKRVLYTESVFVGYRYFDSVGIEPAFCFGHGLSYTTFDFENVSIDKTDDGYEVSVTVRNTGKRYGAEVVQVYLSCAEHPYFMPEQWLAGFSKLVIAPDCTLTAHISLDERAFAHWDVESSSWKVAQGSYEVRIGSSSRDIRHRESVELETGAAPFNAEEIDEVDPIVAQQLESYFDPRPGGFFDEEFQMLYGRALPDTAQDRYSSSTMLCEIGGKRSERVIRRRIVKQVANAIGAKGSDALALVEKQIDGLPLYALTLYGLSDRAIASFVRLLNAIPSRRR